MSLPTVIPDKTEKRLIIDHGDPEKNMYEFHLKPSKTIGKNNVFCGTEKQYEKFLGEKSESV